jgi:hypothetical protein
MIYFDKCKVYTVQIESSLACHRVTSIVILQAENTIKARILCLLCAFSELLDYDSNLVQFQSSWDHKFHFAV